MYEYAPGDTARRPSSAYDHDGPVTFDRAPAARPDEEAVVLDVAAHFAAEHGVPGPDAASDRSASLRAATRRWPLLQHLPPDEASVAEVVELLRDAVDARDRFPRLWAAATERGAVGGRELRQLVRQHRDKSPAESLRIDSDQATVLESEPALWHAVFRASRFLGRLHGDGLTDQQILALLDEHVTDPTAGLLAG